MDVGDGTQDAERDAAPRHTGTRRVAGTSGPVALLEDALVDQIAAGEVVERPASVVKELVENALDAGAERVLIEIREGGAAWIAVSDDGVGMSPEDAHRALQRHATSKIRSADDLQRIESFGFRGEALPAIASVSRLRLLTRPRGADIACEIRVEGGRIVDERQTGAPLGTRVEVADLFSHVPARRKFLKKPTTEWGHISDWLTRSALVLPGVHFEVRRDERPPLVWPAVRDARDRIAAVLSEAEASALIEVEREDGAGRLHGFVSSPEHTRANAQGLYLFVNGRPVRDPLMRSAVLQVYRDWLPRGRFPTAVLFLAVAPESVDVNVHPAKWEVRFADPRAIHQLIRRSLRDTIAERSWLGADPLGRAVAPPATARATAGPTAGAASLRSGDRVADDGGSGRAGATTDWIFARDREERSEVDAHAARDAAAAGDAGPALEGRLRFGDLRLVGQLMASYLVAERKGAVILVDQHAAHERVLYERLRAQWLERGVEGQGLLEPLVVNLEPGEAAALASEAARVERLGFEVELFGEDAVVVRSVPALLAGHDPTALVRELAQELQAETGRSGGAASEDVRLLAAVDRIFATLACHSARRFGDHLEPAEQRSLLDALDAIPWAPTCPHGRPVAVALDRSEIERRFGRR